MTEAATPLDELKPCPFCGGKAGVMKAVGVHQACCADPACPANRTYSTHEEAAKVWNTRSLAAPREEIARIINPIAFSALERCYSVPASEEFMDMKIAREKADAILALPPAPADGVREARASALARRLCQLFDSGGESQRTVRARHASAIFQLLRGSDAEQEKCDADPVGYLQECERKMKS